MNRTIKRNVAAPTLTSTVAAIKCKHCGDTIYSRAHHDFRWCSCGEIAIDGGTNYVKISFKKDRPCPFDVVVEATREQLFDDWSKRRDKYGLIKDLTKKLKKEKRNAKKNN